MEIITVALTTFFTGIGFLIVRNGFFNKVVFRVEATPPMTLAYRLHTGDYAQASKAIKEVEEALRGQGVETLGGFGIFLDNPHTTPKEALRSLTGQVLAHPEQASGVKGLKVVTLESAEHIVTEFPYRNDFSIAMGALRVYTALGRYRKDNQVNETPVMEFYDLAHKKIRYIALSGVPTETIESWAKA